MSCCGLPFPPCPGMPLPPQWWVPAVTISGGSDCSAGSESCERFFFSPRSLLSHETSSLFLRESTHADYPMPFKFPFCWERHLNHGWILDFCERVNFLFLLLVSGSVPRPSILGRHNQRLEIGSEYENSSLKLELMVSSPQSLTSPYRTVP